ncbi:MAG: hypothetical protein M3066_20275 [Actinomycetota bacterium]|nr:hypothetical protein [Actinomycetota bacterium]
MLSQPGMLPPIHESHPSLPAGKRFIRAARPLSSCWELRLRPARPRADIDPDDPGVLDAGPRDAGTVGNHKQHG